MSPHKKFSLLAILAVIFAMAISCSGPQSPITPSSRDTVASTGTHSCLGLWQFYIDPDRGSVEAVPLRQVNVHMNALAFMEPPAGVLLKVDKVVEAKPGQITVDIALTHPNPGAKWATAFDVTGILISKGTLPFPFNATLMFPGDEQVRLLNPDGWTRWWNPVDFPMDADFHQKGYIDGLMGTPLSMGNFDATLNGYKYFASDLESPDSDLSPLDTKMRGAFVPGTKCVRRYVIAYPPGKLVFNYAVDASWAPATGPKPIVIPDSFPESANRAEAYRVEIHDLTNTLAWDSATSTVTGTANFKVWIYDWYNAGKNTVCAFAQNDELQGMCSIFPVGGGDTYSIYNVDLLPYKADKPGDVLVWMDVRSKQLDYQGHVPGEAETFFYQESVNISE